MIGFLVTASFAATGFPCDITFFLYTEVFFCSDIDAMEDAELSNEWIEHLRNRQRRKSVFQRVRAKSWNA